MLDVVFIVCVLRASELAADAQLLSGIIWCMLMPIVQLNDACYNLTVDKMNLFLGPYLG